MSKEHKVTADQFKAAQDPRSTAGWTYQQDQRVAEEADKAASPLFAAFQRERAMHMHEVALRDSRTVVAEAKRQAMPDDEDVRAFISANVGSPTLAVLMNGQNHHGWKLEDLLVQLRSELQARNNRIVFDESEVSQAVTSANQAVMSLLFEAEGHQRRIQALLNTIRADQGPTGKPRIGTGSVG